jgi:hypothetical protein
MKIVLNDAPDFPFDKPRPEAQAMIAAGIARAYVPPEPVKKPRVTNWQLKRFDFDGAPYIRVSCTGCGNTANISGPTAHRTQKFIHCGIAESVPEFIQADYEVAKPKTRQERDKSVPLQVPMVIPI